MDTCNAADWIQALATPLAFVILAFTVRAGVQGKRTDVLMASFERFDALMSERTELLLALAENDQKGLLPSLLIRLESWGTRFWSLQFDQFIWWRHGFVDSEVFRYWLLSRHAEFNKVLSDMPSHEIAFHNAIYEMAWQRASASWAQSPKHSFVDFIEKVRANDISEAMKSCSPKWYRRVGLW